MARPLGVAEHTLPEGRARTVVGWTAAAAVIGLMAFVVGRPIDDAGRAIATPSPSAATISPIAFGTSLDPQSGEVGVASDRFAAGDLFAYSVRSAAPFGGDLVYVEVLRRDGDATEAVQEPSAQKVTPGTSVIAFQVPADALLANFGSGEFVMRIYLDPTAAPIAEGTFRLVETAIPS